MSNPEEQRQAGTPGSTTPGGRPPGTRTPGTTATPRGAGYEQGTGYQQGKGYEPGQAPSTEYYPPAGRRGEREHRLAVLTFTAAAGTLMILSGLWSIAVGIASLSSLHVYVATPAPGYTYRWSLTGWGWGEIGLGILFFAAGVCVFLGMAWARYFGALLAVVSGVASFMFIPFQPFWSIVMIVLNAFIIWALLAPRYEAGEI